MGRTYRSPARTAAGIICVSAILALAVLELLLRSAPSLFGPRLFNHAFSRYGTFPGGLYFREPTSGILFMRPNFSTTAGWNGYFWGHRTDGYGFRNPDGTDERRILLLGDSLIYGHGVEEDQTVAHLLRSLHGLGAYNMSRQGDSLYQHYVMLRLYLEEFRPEVVVLFFFINDMFDIETHRSGQELAEIPAIARFDYGLIRSRADQASSGKHPFILTSIYRSAALRLLMGMAAEVRSSLTAGARAAAGDTSLPSYLEPFSSPRRFAAVSRYFSRLLEDLEGRCRSAGAGLHLVNLELEAVLPAEARPALDKADSFLRQLTGGLDIPYHVTSEIFKDCEDCFLKDDGHFTARGHELLADYLRTLIP